jgi:predicted DNA repair protein MutK
MIGGAYLCFEGFEKLAHKFLHSKEEDDAQHNARKEAVADASVDLVAFEKAKIKGAVRTDFILSAEIIAITLGTVADAPLTQQIIVLSGIAIVMTVGVYGLVAGIVKLDDLGLWMTQKASSLTQAVGNGILRTAPYMMKSLSVIGTAAMFLVGGGILVHGIEPLHHAIEAFSEGRGGALTGALLNGVAGVLAGAVVLAVVAVAGKLWQAIRPAT